MFTKEDIANNIESLESAKRVASSKVSDPRFHLERDRSLKQYSLWEKTIQAFKDPSVSIEIHTD